MVKTIHFFFFHGYFHPITLLLLLLANVSTIACNQIATAIAPASGFFNQCFSLTYDARPTFARISRAAVDSDIILAKRLSSKSSLIDRHCLRPIIIPLRPSNLK
ncbi:hypothetical protein DERP_008706 [Dermatophagoides pteronyssinus]|uniref:Secreted protein n=1 Tax=Dermatophagoides pteronyssinus TaxID=6956 RepID=A0ABQ8IW19_DERPT|nr:hypothetical protein DERP_008706 [Dermatophagoides pteronyssinus]